VSGSIAANGTISSVSGFSGDGSSLTNVNATTFGGFPTARFASTGSNTFTAAQTITSASLTTALSPFSISQADASGGGGQSKLIAISANPTKIGGPQASWSPQPTLYGIGSTGPYQIAIFQSQGNFTDGRISLQRPLVVTGSLTASLQEGYVWVGGAGGVSNIVATSSFGSAIDTGSFATTGSNVFDGNQTITGSLSITGSVSSLPIAVTISSNTASIDMNIGDFFIVDLGASANTFFNVTNFKGGETANILVTTNTASTASFSSNVKQSSGSLYTPTTTSGSKDILTLVSFTTTEAYLASVKNLV